MLVRIFTAYPEYFDNTLSVSLLGAKKKEGVWNLKIINLREYGIGKHKKIDDTSAGGGSGLVLRADVLATALEVNIKNIADFANKDKNSQRKLILTSPRGMQWKQKAAQLMSSVEEINIVCNRFEGVDQRVIDYYNIEEISIGDYILLGGEVVACVMLESILRLKDGFLDNAEATKEESFSEALDGKLEYPHYTMPNVWNGLEIPQVLRSGNHANIQNWRKQNCRSKSE